MSAILESIDQIKNLGIIAGGGMLPMRLLQECDRREIYPFIVAFEGQTDPSVVEGREHIWIQPGRVGCAIRALKSHDVRDLVFIGALRRPSFSELRPDLKAFIFFLRYGFNFFGDNDLLTSIRHFLEREGFRMHGIHAFVEDLLTGAGPVGRYKPLKGDWETIRRGIEAAQMLGALDIGQSIIVQQGCVLAVEGAEGTDQLIRRCKPLIRRGRGAILVKMSKPNQDRDIDLPAIGPETVKNAIEAGLIGIVAETGGSLIIDPERVAALADAHKMFVLGVSQDNGH